MLKINRLKINVITEEGEYYFDETFDKKINFIASRDNTCGKSSCIEAIFYCLGLEELIGGKNEKALKPVFRDKLEGENGSVKVLETKFYLEVENEKKEVMTFFRAANDNVFKSNLIRVYEGSILNRKSVNYYDTYVHLDGSATREKGFHRCLEKFIGFSLPNVFTYDGVERKLYLQVLFAALFIEQKKGWGDIFSGLPTYLKVKEPKKRVIEFLLGLESLENEKIKQRIKAEELDIKSEWDSLFRDINFVLNRNNCFIAGISDKPMIFCKEDIDSIIVNTKMQVEDCNDLNSYKKKLEEKLERLNCGNNTIAGNIDELEEKVNNKQEKLMKYEDKINNEKRMYIAEEGIILTLKNNIERIDRDIQNNKDVRKLEKYGSIQKWSISHGKCPTCGQNIDDSLLDVQNEEIELMDVEQNIKHLNEQKKMLEFSLKTHKAKLLNLKNDIEVSSNILIKERKALRSIRNDLYMEDKKISESKIRERIELENEIESIEEVEKYIEKKILEFKLISERFKKLKIEKAKLPKGRYTKSDLKKIKELKKNFKANLIKYRYKSTIDFEEIDIDKTKLLPVINGFDMKFNSSASDNIRAIWAFIVALLQTSIKESGNHPQILIFDEPGQHSIVANDMLSFIKSLDDINDMQCIIGITIKDEETMEVINELNKEDYKLIMIEDRSMRKLIEN